ncbi:hypothetical protein [Azospirillum melinis]
MKPLSPDGERGFSLLMFSDVEIHLPRGKSVLLQFDNFPTDSRFHSQIAIPDAANHSLKRVPGHQGFTGAVVCEEFRVHGMPLADLICVSADVGYSE